jgi:hypothetical protein
MKRLSAMYVAGALAAVAVLGMPAFAAERMVIAEEFTATW